MKCKHNIFFMQKDGIFCYHCGLYIRQIPTTIVIRETIKCEKEIITKPTVRKTMEADVHQEKEMEENTNHVNPQYAWVSFQEQKNKTINQEYDEDLKRFSFNMRYETIENGSD